MPVEQSCSRFTTESVVSVHIHCHVTRLSVRRLTLRRVVLALLTRLGRADADVGIGFIGDTRMRRLNRVYRKLDRTTDVLAFAYGEAPTGRASPLGDVVISMPVAKRQAKALQCSLDEEVLRLLIHGVLHLVGYDHERGERRARLMRRKEAELLTAFTPCPHVVSGT